MPSPIDRPVVVVCGATGAQGSSVAHYLLHDGGYVVRVLTRNVSSHKALELTRQGAMVVACDLNDEEQVVSALHDSYCVFGLTSFWEHGEEAEIKQGKNLANAAKFCGVKHFVWSSLPHIDGVLPRHWESKIVIEKHLRDSGVPTTSLTASFYFENLWLFSPLRKLSNGALLLDWVAPSEVSIPSFAVEDLALKNPHAWVGKRLNVCVQKLTPREYAGALSQALGTNVTLKVVSVPQFERLKPRLPSEIWLNFKAFLEHPTLLDEDIEPTVELYPGAQRLKEFAAKHREKILGAAVSS